MLRGFSALLGNLFRRSTLITPSAFRRRNSNASPLHFQRVFLRSLPNISLSPDKRIEMPFLKKIDAPDTKVPARKATTTNSSSRTLTEVRMQHYANNMRLAKLLDDCITLFEQGKSASFLLNKIESYAHIHSLNCKRCKSEFKYTKCSVLSDILGLPEILFL